MGQRLVRPRLRRAPYSHGEERLSGRKRHKPKYARFSVGLADRSLSVVGTETEERRFTGSFSRQSPTGLFASTDEFAVMRLSEPEDAALFGPIEW